MMDQLSLLGMTFIWSPHLMIYIQSKWSLPIQEAVCPFYGKAKSVKECGSWGGVESLTFM